MPLYEIEKGGRPPRRVVRQHYAMTRQMLEGKIPMIANLPKIDQMIPALPSAVPTLPREVWGYIRYPYDVAMRLAGYAPASAAAPPASRVKTI